VELVHSRGDCAAPGARHPLGFRVEEEAREDASD
jgi:hypothetical protein